MCLTFTEGENVGGEMEPTPQQIMDAQGTRLSEKAPWETYAEELAIESTPELDAAIEQYAQNYHDNSSNQNKEELARWKEMNDASMGEYRWCTAEEYADIESRLGRIMHSSEFISILRNKLHVRCWYREHPHADKITLLVQRGEGMIPPEVACWVKNGYMPEYTVMGFDEHGVPVAERYRGWRTCLLQMIIKGIVTEEKAHKVFGPAERCCAERYNSILYGCRNTKIE
jgi:hypothetical protein